MLKTEEDVARLWLRLKQFPLLYDDFTWNNPELFLGMIRRQDAVFYEVGDVGLVWFLNVRRGATADLFLAFWAPCPRKDKMELLRIIGRDAFNRLNLKRVGIYCYTANEPIVQMCGEVGAHRDGTLRKAHMLRGELQDVAVFSLLREEFEAWAGDEEWKPELVALPEAPPEGQN